MPSLSTFEDWLTGQDRSVKTIHGYQADLKQFAAWFQQANGCPLQPEKLTPADIREYKNWLLDHHAKPATINRRMAAIRAYGNWAVDTGLIAANPALRIKLVSQVENAPQWLDKSQQYALVRTAEEAVMNAKTEPAQRQARRDKAILLTLLHSGLRVGELIALTLVDVQLSSRKGKLIVRQGKGEKRREVPLNATAREALAEWLAERPDGSQQVFTGSRGDGMTASGVHRRLVELGRIAKVEVHAHTLRHSFSKNLIDAGVSLEKVASLLGHSSLNTTRIYTTPGERDLEAAVERLAG